MCFERTDNRLLFLHSKRYAELYFIVANFPVISFFQTSNNKFNLIF